MDLFRFLLLAVRAYKLAGELEHGTQYAAITLRGVPKVAIFVGVGRNAWRISQRATEEFVVKERS
jgi:hypothetical protein